MKTKELESKVTAVRQIYRIERDSIFIKIKCLFPYGDGVLYLISKSIVGSSIQGSDALDIPEHDRLALQKLAYKYSRTPLDEREDEPKFRVRILPDDNESYLNQSSSEKNLYASNSENIPSDKTIFNKSEYDKLQQEYPEWLPKFDKNDPHFEIVEGENDD